MKTKKLFLTYNNPDDSIILWHKKENETYKISLTLSFDILKDLNQEDKNQ